MSATPNALDRYFRISARGSSVSTELRAGLVTFLTMAYILLVNPQILAQAGMPVADVTAATALGAAFATLLMGLYANFPFALAPGMGLNAYFTYGVVLGMGVSWQVALTAVFVEGLIFIALSFAGIRTALIRAIPLPIKLATTAGIGLFLAIIGLKNAGLVVASPATLVQLGDMHAAGPLLAFAGLLLIAALISRKVKGSLLIGIAVVTLAAWVLGLAKPPEAVFSVPALPRETLWAFDFSALMSMKFLGVVLAFLFVDIFDTAGTLIGVGRAARLPGRQGGAAGRDPRLRHGCRGHGRGRGPGHQHRDGLHRVGGGRRRRRAHRPHRRGRRRALPALALLHPAARRHPGRGHCARAHRGGRDDDGGHR